MQFEDLIILRHVREIGSFAGAARALDMDPSAVSRTVASTEAHLGVRLFERTTRALKETEAGTRYLDRVLPLLDEADAAKAEATDSQQQPTGTLRLSTSVAFAHMCVLPHLAEFRQTFPKVAMTLLPTDRNVDLVGERIDLAFRLAAAPEGDLVSSRICKTRYHVVASPAWVARFGAPKHPTDLGSMDVLRLELPGYLTKWRFRNDAGDEVHADVQGPLIIDSPVSLAQAARDGLGPALLADWMIARDLEEGRLLDLFPEWQATATDFDTGVWALYPSRQYLPGKTRAALDFFRPRLRECVIRR
jgi:DNA-binding transcriptional LysR family regulator